mgnify:CR=1 FL=1
MPVSEKGFENLRITAVFLQLRFQNMPGGMAWDIIAKAGEFPSKRSIVRFDLIGVDQKKLRPRCDVLLGFIGETAAALKRLSVLRLVAKLHPADLRDPDEPALIVIGGVLIPAAAKPAHGVTFVAAEKWLP